MILKSKKLNTENLSFHTKHIVVIMKIIGVLIVIMIAIVNNIWKNLNAIPIMTVY